MGRSSNHFNQWVKSHSGLGQKKTPEECLFIAVLSQAVHDVFSSHVENIDKSQAMDFLTEDSFHLRMICELAGRDSDYVRGKIRAKLLNE